MFLTSIHGKYHLPEEPRTFTRKYCLYHVHLSKYVIIYFDGSGRVIFSVKNKQYIIWEGLGYPKKDTAFSDVREIK